MGFSFRSVHRIVINLANSSQRPVITRARHFVRHLLSFYFPGDDYLGQFSVTEYDVLLLSKRCFTAPDRIPRWQG